MKNLQVLVIARHFLRKNIATFRNAKEALKAFAEGAYATFAETFQVPLIRPVLAHLAAHLILHRFESKLSRTWCRLTSQNKF